MSKRAFKLLCVLVIYPVVFGVGGFLGFLPMIWLIGLINGVQTGIEVELALLAAGVMALSGIYVGYLNVRDE